VKAQIKKAIAAGVGAGGSTGGVKGGTTYGKQQVHHIETKVETNAYWENIECYTLQNLLYIMKYNLINLQFKNKFPVIRLFRRISLCIRNTS